MKTKINQNPRLLDELDNPSIANIKTLSWIHWNFQTLKICMCTAEFTQGKF